ncbi:hypothetical protein [Paraburkholderia dinghuensis]|uniref:Uncharacterized protein n=1 Tax=Paraburkholderia dinghuensis TaxID=2305225 RepID=A0A3N6M841_9BURK|nr:hypothetical protein [Paraburkholderia dinghuensis]RQG99863.1 hypothetical protein D1Y85_25970 [Paraburkholderia dinghuensis]
MTQKDAYIRAARAVVLANGYPPLLRDELLSRADGLNQNAIETDAIVTFGSDRLSFRRSQLYPAVALAFDRVSTPIIKSVACDEWTVAFASEAEPPNVVLVRDRQRILVAQFALLAPEAEGRLHAFQLITDQRRLPSDILDRWRALLSKRVPTDHEIMALRDDLQRTPVGAAEAICECLESGSLSLDILVPISETYYRQLVGGNGGALSMETHVAEVTAPFLAKLLVEGTRQSLSPAWALCSHQSISHLIEREWKGGDHVLADEFSWLTENGDPISCTGAIEVGLLRVRKSPTLSQSLAALINVFLDGEPDERRDPFDRLSALFNCIYGQMARRRVLTAWPPFARRMAALAHASLVYRHIRKIVGESTELDRWLRDVNEGYFVMQTLLDMRVEPRWFPELNSAEQLKNELLGRIWMAANAAPDAVTALGLAERLTGEAPESISQLIDRTAARLPGPLEGGVRSPIPLPPDVLNYIEACLKGAIDTTAFGSLINVSMLACVPDHLVDLACEAIERYHYQIPVNEQVPVSVCLLGLAGVAAVNRNTKLCETIHVLMRVGRHFDLGQLTVDEMFRVGALACAAHADLNDWTGRVGDFMTELSLQNLTLEDATILHSHLSTMCHLVPELWHTCGQAQAALGLVIGR